MNQIHHLFPVHLFFLADGVDVYKRQELDSDNFVLCKRGVIVNLEFVKKGDTVNRYILLEDDFGSLEIGPILKNDFIKKMKARGII